MEQDQIAPRESRPKERTPFLGLLQRRPSWILTWRGWLLLLLACTGLVMIAGRRIPSFLAVNDPLAAEVLVVEGWVPDYALMAAISEFKKHPYERLYVTGGPLEIGAPLSEYKTYAELGAAILIRSGLSDKTVQAVPAPAMRKDRTYASAVALKDWLREHGASSRNVNILSIGPHARRTRLMYEKAMGEDTRVGMIAIEDRDYAPDQWWKSSAGVRSILDELIAYGYARFFFRAPKG